MRGVVITAMGVQSVLGDSPGQFYESLLEGRRPISPISIFPTEGLNCTQAFEISGFDPRTYLGKQNFRPLNRPAQLAVVAARDALEAAGAEEDSPLRAEMGMVLGTVYCSVRTIAEFDRNAITNGPKYAKPMDFANTVINAAAGQTALWHNLQGLNSTICGGVGSGLAAIIYAADLIALGRADALLAGGLEELCFESLHAYERAGLLSDTAPRPFSKSARGFLLGEGAAFLVLEEENHARERGATILAEVRGSASGFDRTRGADAEHSAHMMGGVMRRALLDAGLNPDGLGCISSGANGSDLDLHEASALNHTFDGRVPITAVKACSGEALGASGAFQTLAMIEAIRDGRCPGTPEVIEDSALIGGLSDRTAVVAHPTGMATAFSRDGNGHALVLGATS